MRIGVPKETAEGERRVALVPEGVRKLVSPAGGGEAPPNEVLVQRGAGAGALIPDQHSEEAGARLVDDLADVYGCDAVLKVQAPKAEEIGRLGSNSVLVGFLAPLTNADGIRAIAQ